MPSRLRSPIPWFGGKGNMTGRLLPLFPPHRHYVEVFGGGASLLLAKKPAGGVEVYNDINHALYDFFSVLSKPELFEKFYRRVAVLPWSRQLYEECKATWAEQEDLIERVVRWYVVAKQSFSGIFGRSWSMAVTGVSRGMGMCTSRWLSAIELLPEIHARLQRVQIECADFRKILQKYDGPDYLAYCDPPYLHETRSSTRYEFDMTREDHEDLVNLLLQYDGKVVLSGYPNEVYRLLEDAGWKRVEFQTVCHAVGHTRQTGILGPGAAKKKVPRVECVWIKGYPPERKRLL